MLKLAFLMWIAAMALSFFAKAEDRKWLAPLFLGGFCLVLLAVFFKLIRL